MRAIPFDEIAQRLRTTGYDVTICEDTEFVPPATMILEITNVDDVDTLRTTVHALHGDDGLFDIAQVDATNDAWYTVTLWEGG